MFESRGIERLRGHWVAEAFRLERASQSTFRKQRSRRSEIGIELYLFQSRALSIHRPGNSRAEPESNLRCDDGVERDEGDEEAAFMLTKEAIWITLRATVASKCAAIRLGRV